MNRHDRFLALVLVITGMREKGCDIIFKDENLGERQFVIEAINPDTMESKMYRYCYDGDFAQIHPIVVVYEECIYDGIYERITEFEENLVIHSGFKVGGMYDE